MAPNRRINKLCQTCGSAVAEIYCAIEDLYLCDSCSKARGVLSHYSKMEAEMKSLLRDFEEEERIQLEAAGKTK